MKVKPSRKEVAYPDINSGWQYIHENSPFSSYSSYSGQVWQFSGYDVSGVIVPLFREDDKQYDVDFSCFIKYPNCVSGYNVFHYKILNNRLSPQAFHDNESGIVYNVCKKIITCQIEVQKIC